jgi:hypothetical protein
MLRGEIMRRFSLSGVAALKAASDGEQKKVQQQHQATMTEGGAGRGEAAAVRLHQVVAFDGVARAG